MSKKEIMKELEKELNQFARFAVIGFRGIKEGEEIEYFDNYVKDKAFGGRIKQLFLKTAKG